MELIGILLVCFLILTGIKCLGIITTNGVVIGMCVIILIIMIIEFISDLY